MRGSGLLNKSKILNNLGVSQLACVFSAPTPVCISSMNATALYFESLMAQESTEIARGLRRRDPDLLDRLIEQYQHRLLRYLLYLTGRRELAEDLFQETWIRVLERGHQYNAKFAFGTWLFAVARNLTIDYMRRKQPASLDGLLNDNDEETTFDVPSTGRASAFDLTLQREQNEQIVAGMQHLPAEYREALVLRFQEGMSLEEIAGVARVPLGTVKSRIYRGLSALEPWLKGASL
jgi:RNA polymerase sigma-70 factor (ECF subfamily)